MRYCVRGTVTAKSWEKTTSNSSEKPETGLAYGVWNCLDRGEVVLKGFEKEACLQSSLGTQERAESSFLFLG